MDYRFKPISKTCYATNEPLQPGSECYSVLVEVNGQFERRDYSPKGWQGRPEESVGFWKCRVPEPEQKHASTVDPETLLQYFEQLLEEGNTQQQKLCYVLALYLLQRRRLKLDGSKTSDDAEYLLLSGSRGEGPYEVRDQQLDQAEMESLQLAINQQLTTQWNAA